MVTVEGANRELLGSFCLKRYALHSITDTSPAPNMKFSFAALFSCSLAGSDEEWSLWKTTHGKNYATAEEETHRRTVFEKNLVKAAELQKSNPVASFGATRFSDWTDMEWENFFGVLPDPATHERAPKSNSTNVVPDSKDWTGIATTPVRDQGHCNSCWAVAAVEQLESAYILQGNEAQLLSVQQLVDCKPDRSRREGCTVPATSALVPYKVVGVMGIEPEADYPYEGTNGECRFDGSKTVLSATNEHFLPADAEEMKSHVGSIGPLGACAMVGAWKPYTGGIITECNDSDPKCGHCFQIVGYGSENGQDYWKVRNSWGTDYGENGFVRVARGQNLCQIEAHAHTADPITKAAATAVAV